MFLLVAVGAGLSGMATMSRVHHEVVDVTVPKQLAADEAQTAASDMHFAQTEYALDEGASRPDYEDDRAVFRATLVKLAAHSTTAVRSSRDGADQRHRWRHSTAATSS